MSAACRSEAGGARATLVLGIVGSGAAIAWLVWTIVPRVAGSTTAEVRQQVAARERGSSPSDDPAELSSGERTSATSPAATPTPTVPASPVPGWEACLPIEDPEQLRRCLAEKLHGRPDAAAIARALCRDSPSHGANRAVLAEALLRIPPQEALAWIAPAEAACPRLLGWGDLENALEACEIRDPTWFQAFRQTLTPDALFAPASGEAGILFSVWFLKRGDLEMRTWIEKGARGEWGGTSAQIDRAIGASLTIPRSGEERLAFLRSVLASTSVPGEAGIGATFVHQLLDSRSWPEGQSPAALDTLMQVLYEPQFQESAAATICLHFPVEPPAGCDPDMWLAIRARALEIARAIGLVTR